MSVNFSLLWLGFHTYGENLVLKINHSRFLCNRLLVVKQVPREGAPHLIHLYGSPPDESLEVVVVEETKSDTPQHFAYNIIDDAPGGGDDSPEFLHSGVKKMKDSRIGVFLKKHMKDLKASVMDGKCFMVFIVVSGTDNKE